jgi:hypothetical protein
VGVNSPYYTREPTEKIKEFVKAKGPKNRVALLRILNCAFQVSPSLDENPHRNSLGNAWGNVSQKIL